MRPNQVYKNLERLFVWALWILLGGSLIPVRADSRVHIATVRSATTDSVTFEIVAPGNFVWSGGDIAIKYSVKNNGKTDRWRRNCSSRWRDRRCEDDLR